MSLPRSKHVREGQEGVYHCFSRCVRRAFLHGFDAFTGRDFSHRKAWLVDRLRHLAAIFAIDVCAYAIMDNHYHIIVRTRPDIVADWSDLDVAARWLTLFPQHGDVASTVNPFPDQEIRALADCPERIAKLRQRLCSLSWFMARLNEFIARAANKEDSVKGRFWEGRFKCQVLLDQAAIAACMVYVDLNPIRAGLSASPEESDFASIQERIRDWQKAAMMAASARKPAPPACQRGSVGSDTPLLNNGGASNPITRALSAASYSSKDPWLCPIPSDCRRRGILRMTTEEYFDLVDRSGRITRSDRRGTIDADLASILLRIGVNPDAWIETTSRFGSKFHLAAGLLSNLRHFADQLGQHWIKGVATARSSFALSPAQLA